MVRYLEGHRGGGGLMDAAVASAALGRGTGHLWQRQVLEGVVSRVPEFAGTRKRALVRAIFTMLGVGDAPDNVDSHAFDVSALHPWAAVQAVAVKAILAGGRAPVGRDDVALLVSTQRLGTVWEGNLLVHLSVLHALVNVPGMEGVVDAGLRTTFMHQREDGGLPFVTDTDTWCTVIAGLALCSSGAPYEVLHHIAGHLVRVQHANGGWSYTDGAQLTDTDCTTVAVEFLHELDADTYRDPIRDAVDSLIAVRGADGGFPTYGAGTPSEACMTAAAVNALSTQGRHDDVVQPALRFLAGCQKSDGSFPPGWSGSCLHTPFRAYLAAHPGCRQFPPAVHDMNRRIIGLVQASQNEDGGFGQRNGTPSDAISTAYALIILLGQADPAPAVRAARYLLAQQRSDGGVSSVPDMLGPRPFPYHVPLLTDAFTLLALGHLTRRIRHSGVIVPPRRHRGTEPATTAGNPVAPSCSRPLDTDLAHPPSDTSASSPDSGTA
ncbi:prenyltransferase/squalene oxidase repeat-containing protein [Streptomyces sp. NPDC005426]|uniref:prenyltransferase/squalene oxidase repeat-containing protein n=1 Tax=Streptomyces sp. NPDC005426 TaxID=3155344 RepID=UPI0033B96473